MARLIIHPVGSHGDVHPFLALGKEMQQRGHDVVVLASGKFAGDAETAGLPFVALGTAEEYDEYAKRLGKIDTRVALKAIISGIASQIPKTLGEIKVLAEKRPHETVLIASSLGFAARMARDIWGIPLITGHLAPSAMQSAHDVPLLDPKLAWLQRAPRPLTRLFFGFGALVIDNHFGLDLQKQLRAHGLPRASNITGRWWNSPDAIIGFWPEWFGAIQPDHPRNLELVGFPYYQEENAPPLDEGLEQWLAEGDAPVVFAAGSGNALAGEFFAKAVDTCRHAGRRGLLMSKYADHIPKTLPREVRHQSYAPFARLLPRCAAIIHHGGIGTTAQAIAARIPQLIVPMAFDQFDNADRIHRLGLGSIAKQSDASDRLASSLNLAVESFDAHQVEQYAAEVHAGAQWDRVCERIDQLLKKSDAPNP